MDWTDPFMLLVKIHGLGLRVSSAILEDNMVKTLILGPLKRVFDTCSRGTTQEMETTRGRSRLTIAWLEVARVMVQRAFLILEQTEQWPQGTNRR